MSQYGEKAKKNFLKGYTCSQAVLCAFSDKIGLDEGTLMKFAAPFGGGMGRMREVCGAFSGLLMAAGYLLAPGEVMDQNSKADLYTFVQQMAEQYKEKNGRSSILCRELLGQKNDGPVPEERTPEYYRKRPCGDLVQLCADILAEYLGEE